MISCTEFSDPFDPVTDLCTFGASPRRFGELDGASGRYSGGPSCPCRIPRVPNRHSGRYSRHCGGHIGDHVWGRRHRRGTDMSGLGVTP